MSEPGARRWIEAGRRIAADPAAAVPCPECGRADLRVTDAKAGDVIERWMRCPECGAFNTLRLAGPGKTG